jgi:hypothetical protein
MTDSILRAIDLIEIMADRIPEGPQATPDVERAMTELRRHGATSETLRFIWSLLSRDIREGSGGQFIGVYRALDSALNRLANEVQQQRPDPGQLREAKAKTGFC